MTHKNSLEQKSTRRLQKQLTAYSVAAGAALALANPADAAIINYNGPALPVDLNTSQSIDIDGSGSIDFVFSAGANFSPSSPSPWYANPIGGVGVSGAQSNQIIWKGLHPTTYWGSYGTSWARRLPTGYQIGAANPNWTYMGLLQAQATWMGFSVFAGSFNGKTGFIGVTFEGAGSYPYLGWIEYEGDANSLSGTILGWSYESNPLAPIDAGAVGAVPLPGTFGLGLLALGAAGVARLRQRKNETKEETA